MSQVMGWMEQLPGITDEILSGRQSIEALISEAIELGNEQAVLFAKLMALRAQSDEKRLEARLQAESLESRVRELWPSDVIERAKAVEQEFTMAQALPGHST